MNKLIDNKVVIENLANEISSLLADNLYRQWDDTIRYDETITSSEVCLKVDQLMALMALCSTSNEISLENLRRNVATALYYKGDESIGLQGVEFQIFNMLQKDKISAKSLLTGSPFVNGSNEKINLGYFFVSAEEAEKVMKCILPDRIYSNVAAKIESGRYTLEEAADFFESQINSPESLEEGNEEPCSSEPKNNTKEDESSWIHLEMLKNAALSGHLPTFQPGKDIQMKYDSVADVVVREYYEEVRWSDLNNWLEKFHQNIHFRFPNPDQDDLKSTTKGQDKKGVEKKEILGVDWPEGKFPSGVKKGPIPSLEKILNELPDWVRSACIKVGRPGGNSHLWNPAQLAYCLVITTSHKKWTVNKKQLTNFLADKFPDYLEYWENVCLSDLK